MSTRGANNIHVYLCICTHQAFGQVEWLIYQCISIPRGIELIPLSNPSNGEASSIPSLACRMGTRGPSLYLQLPATRMRFSAQETICIRDSFLSPLFFHLFHALITCWSFLSNICILYMIDNYVLYGPCSRLLTNYPYNLTLNYGIRAAQKRTQYIYGRYQRL